MKAKTTKKTVRKVKTIEHDFSKDLKRTEKGRKIAAMEAEFRKKMGNNCPLGFHPHNFTQITMSENNFYEISIMALRYAMGGGTIATEGVIGDIIRIAGFSDVASRIAHCICPDFEKYLEDRVRIWRDPKPVSQTWTQCYDWLKAIRDDTFRLLHCEGKVNGKKLVEDHLCFKSGGRWIDAVEFRRNQSAVAYIGPEYIQGNKDVSWRIYLSELAAKENGGNR